MAPRAYQSTKREAAVAETRARIIAAAGEVIARSDDPRGFSVDAVAREADVARMTIYHQFQSKRGLFEALCDDMAAQAQLGPRLGAAHQLADPLDSLDALIVAFAHFWTVNRAVVRRLDAVAALNTEIGHGNRERNERRRTGVRSVLERVSAKYGSPTASGLDQAVDIVQMLTSFASFDGLAGPTRTPRDVVPLIQRLVRPAVGLPTPDDGDRGVARP